MVRKASPPKWMRQIGTMNTMDYSESGYVNHEGLELLPDDFDYITHCAHVAELAPSTTKNRDFCDNYFRKLLLEMAAKEDKPKEEPDSRSSVEILKDGLPEDEYWEDEENDTDIETDTEIDTETGVDIGI